MHSEIILKALWKRPWRKSQWLNSVTCAIKLMEEGNICWKLWQHDVHSTSTIEYGTSIQKKN